MSWKTRQHGSRKQVGKAFLTKDYPRYKARRKALFMSLELRERLARKLSRISIDSAHYNGKKITVKFDRQVLSNKVEIVPHERWVGSWSRFENTVYIDDDVPKEYHKFVAVHETVEKYLKEKHGMNPNAEGHELAEAIEKRFFLRTHSTKEWDEYSQVVERIHRKESA